MGIAHEIDFESVDNLCLDPMNPRLGRNRTGRDVTQERVLELMRGWTLDELAVSFVESGFWPQEALIVVREELYGEERNIVVEGNRRLGALLLLRDACGGRPLSRRWASIAESGPILDDLFQRVPIVRAGDRRDVEAFLGFRHVTGIKEWDPAEKAEFIAKLIEVDHLSYEHVMRRIGSKTEPVRRNYIAYRLLLQMEDHEEIAVEQVEERFSLLFLGLREAAIQEFLGINIQADPEEARTPVAGDHLAALVDFTRWMFGSADEPPLFSDSREIGRFADILESTVAVAYLRETKRPNFEVAWQKSGADESQVIKRIQAATDEIEQALGRIHLFAESEGVQKVVDRFGRDAFELLRKFPKLYEQLVEVTRPERVD